MKKHKLKTWEEYYLGIYSKQKQFEVRKNDRDFKVGHILILQEYNKQTGEYTGRETEKTVTYILTGGRFGIEEGYCVMGVK